MRRITGKKYSTSSKIHTVCRSTSRAVEFEKVRIWNQFPSEPSISATSLQKFSIARVVDKKEENVETIVKPHLNFDHRLFWKAHGDIVRHLLECGTKYSDVEAIGKHTDSSSLTTFPKLHFEQAYAADAIYQDLFIDSPPCRDTLKFSFELINRFWEIKIIEWNAPSLMTTIRKSKMNIGDGNCNEWSINYQKFYHSTEDITTEAIGTRPSLSSAIFLRVPYTAKQRPRLSFLPSTLCNMFPRFSANTEKFFEFYYEGWIELYIRPKSSSTARSSAGSNCWEIYRHDDRLRVDPSSLFIRYLQGTNKHMKGSNSIDALAVVEQLTLISIVFQWFRWAHGMTVWYVARKKVKR